MAGLTDVKVRSAKSPDGITKLSDGGGRSLQNRQVCAKGSVDAAG